MNDLTDTTTICYLKQLPDNRYIALNRWHKPIGVGRDRFVKYDEYQDVVFAFNITPAIATLLSCNADPDTSLIQIHNSRCKPFSGNPDHANEFARRLNILKLLLDYESPEKLAKRRWELQQGEDPTQEEIKATLLHEPVLYALAMVVHDAPPGSPREFEGNVQELYEAVLKKDLDIWMEGCNKLNGPDRPSLDDFIDALSRDSHLELLGDVKVMVLFGECRSEHGSLNAHTPIKLIVPSTKGEFAA